MDEKMKLKNTTDTANTKVGAYEVVSDEEIEEILIKYDRESAYRRIPGVFSVIISVIAITFSLFQLYTAAFGVLPAQIQRAVHLGFGVTLTYLLYPATRKGTDKLAWYDVVLAVLGVLVMSYPVWNFHSLLIRAGAYTKLDIVIGAIGILLVLEATRRVVGTHPHSSECCLAYLYFGRHTRLFSAQRRLCKDL